MFAGHFWVFSGPIRGETVRGGVEAIAVDLKEAARRAVRPRCPVSHRRCQLTQLGVRVGYVSSVSSLCPFPTCQSPGRSSTPRRRYDEALQGTMSRRP